MYIDKLDRRNKNMIIGDLKHYLCVYLLKFVIKYIAKVIEIIVNKQNRCKVFGIAKENKQDKYNVNEIE